MEADASQASSSASSGLTTQEAAELLAKFGPNSVAEEREHPLRVLWSKFWAPVPWMLEAAVLLEVLLHKKIEAGVIAGLARRPDRWRIRTLVLTAAPLAGLLVMFSLSVLLVGRNVLALSTAQIQTLAFLTLVFGGQGTVYLVRERCHLWHSRPSRWMLLSSGVDLVIVSALATLGILMTPIPFPCRPAGRGFTLPFCRRLPQDRDLPALRDHLTRGLRTLAI